MKILFVNAYFMPEVIAFSHLEKDLIEGFLKDGHEIEIICPIPTRGISASVVKKYSINKKENLYNGKVVVRRFWAPQERRSTLTRAFRYFWCNIREYQIGKRYQNIDAIFAVSTPPTQGLLAGMLGKKLGCPFIYSLQDIFPDSLVTTGLTKKGSLIWNIGRWIEKKTYEYSSHIVVISESCRRNLINKGVNALKVSMISNWVDIGEIQPVKREENSLISELNLDKEKFIVVYAGNFGAAQGAEIVLYAAELLKAEKNILFVIFGGGAGFKEANDYVKNNKLKNVIINPLLSQNRISEVYSLGNVALITCKSGVGNSGMPSKTWNIMACNTPIIASFDIHSDLAEILNTSKGGVCVEPGNAEALAKTIYLFKEKGYFENNGRDYVIKNASRKQCVRKYIELVGKYANGTWGESVY